MSRFAPKTVERVTLDANEARNLWVWLLARQGLSEETKFGTALGVATASLGLHAARLQSPFATVFARTGSASVAAELFATQCRSDMVTVRCMRKTLHILPLHLAAAAHAATVHFRERDALRAIENAGVSRRKIEDVIENVIGMLGQSGPLFHRHIEERLRDPSRSISMIRLAIKLGWESGRLVYLNDSIGWNREDRRFALTAALYPSLNMQMERSRATAELVEAYFDRYGPATTRDAMWWSGLSNSAILDGLRTAGREIVEFCTPWSDAPLYMFRDRFQEFCSVDHERLGICKLTLNFLAHEDVALKAYFESRNRYLNSIPARSAFNQIGEALPTILLGGHVIGTWSWNRETMEVEWSAISHHVPAALRKQVISRAEVLSEALRQGFSPRESAYNLTFEFNKGPACQ